MDAEPILHEPDLKAVLQEIHKSSSVNVTLNLEKTSKDKRLCCIPIKASPYKQPPENKLNDSPESNV